MGKTWLASLAAEADSYEDSPRGTAALAAVALGELGLVAPLAGIRPAPFSAGERFGADSLRLASYLAAGVNAGATARDVAPAVASYIDAFPSRLNEDNYAWGKLGYLARVYTTHFLSLSPESAGTWLRAAVRGDRSWS